MLRLIVINKAILLTNKMYTVMVMFLLAFINSIGKVIWSVTTESIFLKLVLPFNLMILVSAFFLGLVDFLLGLKSVVN